MKKSIRAVISGLAAFGTTAAHGVPYDETGVNDLGNTFATRTILPSDTSVINGAGDDDFFHAPGFPANGPFRFALDASCPAESQSAGDAVSCAAMELGPVMVTVGDSPVDAIFEYGFLGLDVFSVATGDGSSGSMESSEPMESGSEPMGSGSEPMESGSEPMSSASEPMSSMESGEFMAALSGESMESESSASEESSGGGGPGPSPMSLGPLFSFYDGDGSLMASFELPELTRDASPFVISGRALDDGSVIGRLEWGGPYSLSVRPSAAVPEPATTGLVMAGGVAAAIAAKRKRKRKPEG